MKKRYDLFVSYSSLDREAVDALVQQLHRHHLSVWYDKWEMKPGDRLRDRINDGIKSSHSFLVMLSEHSVNAPWVKVELDSAMLRELETNRIVVIPVLIGDVAPSQMPPDLRGKHYLDLRNAARVDQEIARLLALFDLDRRHSQQQRRDRLRDLRQGLLGSKNPVAELREVIRVSSNDYTQQKAALAGLACIGSARAMCCIADRMLDLGGVAPLEYCTVLCCNASEKGGLFLLSATLFYDSRFISSKLDAMKTILRDGSRLAALLHLTRLGDTTQLHREPAKAKEWNRTLSSSPEPDVAYGSIFGAQFDIGMGWQRKFMEKFSTEEVTNALGFAERLITGIGDTFRKASDGQNRYLETE